MFVAVEKEDGEKYNNQTKGDGRTTIGGPNDVTGGANDVHNQ